MYQYTERNGLPAINSLNSLLNFCGSGSFGGSKNGIFRSAYRNTAAESKPGQHPEISRAAYHHGMELPGERSLARGQLNGSNSKGPDVSLVKMEL